MTNPVIPVLDLMIGQIVLAEGGDRGNYLPVQSRLTTSSQPLDVAKALFGQTGCDELYLADIDSFAGANPNWQVYNQLLAHGFKLAIDADWITHRRFDMICDKIDEPDKVKVIISSETLSSVAQFESFGQLRQQGLKTVFSLDLRSDQVITRPGNLEEAEVMDLVMLADEQGVESLIVLDLSVVGTMQGTETQQLENLISQVKQRFPAMSLITGGGIRGPGDIQSLLDIGYQQVLVASAIHHCQITPYDVAELMASHR